MSIISRLEIIRTQLAGGSQHEALKDFTALPEDEKNFLLWGIWVNDRLCNKEDLGNGHGLHRITADPSLLTQQSRFKVIHGQGDSLVEQLIHSIRERLAITEARGQAQIELQIAADRAKADQMRLLKPHMSRAFFKDQFETYLSEDVQRLLQATGTNLYETRGAHFDGSGTTFTVFAPNARSITCKLTYQGNVTATISMEKQADGTWMGSSKDVRPGQTYMYEVINKHGEVQLRVDPFSFGNLYVPEKDHVESVVVNRTAFHWTHEAWCKKRETQDPKKHPLSVFEMHIKSWDRDGKMNLRELAPRIADYCQEMGYTHVELYGIMEHFWGKGRGYQVTNYFAPYHQCGSYDDMKYFVNYLHEKELGVIIDWIPTHFDHGGHNTRHTSASMYAFDGTDDLATSEECCWGTKFIDHGKEEARRLLEASALWWINEMGVDGLRFDAVSELIHRNEEDIHAGIDFLTNLNRTIHSKCPGVFTIAEASSGEERFTKSLGFDFMWNFGTQNLRHYLRTPDNERQDHHEKLERVFHESKVFHRMSIHTHDNTDRDQSHDVMLFRLGQTHSTVAQRMADVRNFHSWLIFGPGSGHLMHMGDEMAAPEAWYPRFQSGKSGVDWDCLNEEPHRQMRTFVKDALHYYRKNPDFWSHGDHDAELLHSYAPNKVIAFSRGNTLVVQNNSRTNYANYDIPFNLSKHRPLLDHLVEKLNSNAAEYGGSGHYTNQGEITLLRDQSGAYGIRLKLPAQSTLILGQP